MKIARTLSAALALALLPLAATAQEKVVNVYNWSDYVGEGVLEDFTKETGIEVVYDVYDSNEMLETKLLAGGSGYDVIVPTDRDQARMIQSGVRSTGSRRHARRNRSFTREPPGRRHPPR